MGVNAIPININCSDDYGVSELNFTITYGGDTIYEYSTNDDYINQSHFIENNLTQDVYSTTTSCIDNSSQITYDYGTIIIYNYFNMSILTPYMNQYFFVPDIFTPADINMTWVINQFAYCCDAVNDIWIGCDYVPADVETYNQYLLTIGTYNITRACTIPDSYASIQDYRIVHVEIPIIPYCILSNTPLYYYENVTISANLTTSELSWVEFVWNNTQIYNRSFAPATSNSINETNSIKNKIPINETVQFGYNFSDSLNIVTSCYNEDTSIERPYVPAPILSLTTCPSTLESISIFFIILAIAMIFIILGMVYNTGTIGLFGAFGMLFISPIITSCFIFFGLLMIGFSLVMIIIFIFKVINGNI
jgi:hypothetical protein